ncbi:MAG TPA: hypothetical protein VNF48_08110 [Gammaproteobacteria bacterium]|nr:hypothetical protein [Gammaproteobacteria bacterium]
MYNQTLPGASLIACPGCNLLQRLPELIPGESARCPRCNMELQLRKPDSIHKPLALNIRLAARYLSYCLQKMSSWEPGVVCSNKGLNHIRAMSDAQVAADDYPDTIPFAGACARPISSLPATISYTLISW